ALDELNALLAARRRTRSLVLVEFASTDYAQTVKALPALREFELHVLSVTAPLEIARRRNRLRPPLYRVPDAFVTAAATASPDSLRGRVGTDRYAAIDNRAQWDPGALDARLRAVLVGWGLGPPGKLMCR
ncbi:hypothetical protein, partial [Actinomadura sp.]|uniref:hypothetical protein n=2 Tax=Actinomadura sp. TaxID=1989 RepID=UPI0037C73912